MAAPEQSLDFRHWNLGLSVDVSSFRPAAAGAGSAVAGAPGSGNGLEVFCEAAVARVWPGAPAAGSGLEV